jgi:filamentous hemagglutinin
VKAAVVGAITRAFWGAQTAAFEIALGQAGAGLGLGCVGGRVASRINLAGGPTRFTPVRLSGATVSSGWGHVLSGHFGRAGSANRSVFTIGATDLRTLLQSPQVVGAPAILMPGGQFRRVVDVGQVIGTSALRNGGGPTSVLEVYTDQAGNLITAFPR